MSKEKYVAYISSYTQGDSHGIRIYDVDMKNGRFKEKGSSWVRVDDSPVVPHTIIASVPFAIWNSISSPNFS